MYPHQVLMEEQGLTRNDLSKEAKGYLTDFNNQYRGIDLKRGRAEKAGKEFVLTPEDDAKLQRFSKSVCVQIYQDINSSQEELRKERERKEAVKREAIELKRKQEEEEKQRIEQEKAREQARIEEIELRKQEQRLIEEEKKKQEEEEEQSGSIFDYFF